MQPYILKAGEGVIQDPLLNPQFLFCHCDPSETSVEIILLNCHCEKIFDFRGNPISSRSYNGWFDEITTQTAFARNDMLLCQANCLTYYYSKSPTQKVLVLQSLAWRLPKLLPEVELPKLRRIALVAYFSLPDHKAYQEEPKPRKLSGSWLKSAVPVQFFVLSSHVGYTFLANSYKSSSVGRFCTPPHFSTAAAQ